ncbi:MAG: type VI secretion system baseplate subunit TssG [Candidatus Eisenbacteria bacterium]
MNDALRQPAHAWEFHPLVRELVDATAPPLRPGHPGDPADERVFFRSNPSLGFPPAEIASAEWEAGPGGTSRATVVVNFMGLLGTASPMPLHFVQEALWERQEPEGKRLADFLAMFEHRMLSFQFRAREKYRHALRFHADGEDEFTGRVLALAGLDSRENRAASGVELRHLLRGLGMLAARQRSAHGLEELLEACFPGIAVRVTSCIARRRAIPEDQQLFLHPGRHTAPRRDDALGGLGRDTCIGTSRMDASSQFRVAMGPMKHGEFRRFLPGEPDFAQLAALIRLYVKDPLDFDIELHLEADQRPAARLVADGGQRLGQNTWLTPTDEREGVSRFRAPGPNAPGHPGAAPRAA